MTAVRQNIPITEPWLRTSWKNFTSYQPFTTGTALGDQASPSYPFGLTTQNHINLRNFDPVESWEIIAVGQLLPIEGLFPTTQLYPGGALSAGGTINTLPSAAYNYWPMATANCNPGSNVYVNVIAESIYLPVDITTIGSESALTVALPNFPLASIDLNNSSFAFSSDGFTSNQINLNWSDSITTPINGHSTLTWPYSAIAGNVDNVDLTKINGVVILITATATVDVRFMALRLIANNWVQTDVDFNTLTHRLTQCIPRNGDPTAVVVDSNKTVPILWRSNDVPGVDDPRPINAEISAEFNTGTALNSLSQSQSPQGNWIGTYGQDGYYLPAFSGGTADVFQLPFFSTVATSGGTRAPASWVSNTTDARALRDPTGSFRNAYTYYTTTSETIQFTAPQDYNGTMSVYCVDWDSGGRAQTLSCQGQTANLSSFVNGAWVTFAVSVAQGQALMLTITNTGGPNAVVSGIFFGGGPQVNGSCSIYMRGESLAFISMLDLEGSTMQELSGKQQPSLGVSTVAPRTMADLERYDAEQLDIQTMRNMEAMQDIVTVSWIKFTVQWGANPLVQITSSSDLSGASGGYKFTNVRLASATNYLMVCNLTDTTTRMYIYQLNPVTKAIGQLVFDTTLIPDGNEFPRYPGRIGLQTSLQNDSFVGPVRPRGLMFAEYRSAALNSITPVGGAQLYVDQTPDIQLWQNWTEFADQSGNEPTITADINRSTTGSSTAVKVINVSTTPQGIQSNWLTPINDDISGITDFNEAIFEFDLWFPSGGFQFATQNLCANPSFEYDPNSVAPFGWNTPTFSAGGTTATFLVQEIWANKGIKSLHIIGNSVSSSGVMTGQMATAVPAASGLSYSAQMTFNVLSANTAPQLLMDFYDSNNNHLAQVLNTGLTISIQTLKLTSLAPPNTSYVNISWGLVNQSGSAQTVDGYLDTVMLVESNTLPTYFDGDSPGYTWAGIPGESMSVTGQPLTIELVSEDGAVYPLTIPKIIPDQWQHMELDSSIALPSPQSGKYRLVFNYYGLPTTWWVDGVKVAERSVTWNGRSVVDDASHSNYAPWTAFRELINSDSDGIRFSTQGNQLQMRGQALRQNAVVINSPKIVPRYAQLGRLAWPEDSNKPIYHTTSIATTQGPTSASDSSIVGTLTWSNPTNITTQDAVYSSFSSSTNGAASHYLMASNFGFLVPGDATIIGIVATVYLFGTQTAYASTSGQGNISGGIQDRLVQLLAGGSPASTNRSRIPSVFGSTLGLWPTVRTPITYGHPNDLWNSSWIPLDINQTNFGVALSGTVVTGGGVSQSGNVDYVAMTVYYQPSGSSGYAPVVLVTSTHSGRTYTFNGSLSTSPLGNRIGAWYWSFGDGTFDSGPVPIHTYQSSGTYVVTLQVTDQYGLVNTGSQIVEVS